MRYLFGVRNVEIEDDDEDNNNDIVQRSTWNWNCTDAVVLWKNWFRRSASVSSPYLWRWRDITPTTRRLLLLVLEVQGTG